MAGPGTGPSHPSLAPAAKERQRQQLKKGTVSRRTQKDPTERKPGVCRTQKDPTKNDISTRSSAIAAKEMGFNARTGKPYDKHHVAFVRDTYQTSGELTPRPRFRDAYNEVANAKPARQDAPRSTNGTSPIRSYPWKWGVQMGVDIIEMFSVYSPHGT